MNETTSIDKINLGFGLSLAIVAILNALLTLGKEVIPGVKDIAVAVGRLIGIDHHWIGHSILIILIFIILGFLFSLTAINDFFIEKFAIDQQRLLIIIVIGVIIGIGLIGGFFFMDAFLG